MRSGVGRDECEFWLLADWWMYDNLENSSKMDLDQLGIVVLGQSQDSFTAQSYKSC